MTVKIFQTLEGLDPAVRSAIMAVIEELEKTQREQVTRDEFLELKEIVKDLALHVKELAIWQEKTEKRLEEIAQWQARTEKRLEELAQWQAKTEKRLEELAQWQAKTEKRLEELAQWQARTEKRLEELAQWQARTEKRLEELAQSQAKTEKTLKELVEAQKRTEERLEKLIAEHEKTRKHLGGLTHTIGYYLEDRAIWHLPALLKRDFDISVEGNLRRGFIEVKPSKYIEVNVWGEGFRNGEPIAILGEAKTQLKKSEVDEFMERVAKVKKLTGKEIFPVLITYYTTPQVQKILKERGIALYFSYELRD